jgi:hypothetical protein
MLQILRMWLTVCGNEEEFMEQTEYLIIDTLKPLGRFLKDTAFFRQTQYDGEVIAQEYIEDYLDQVLDRVIDCVSHEHQAHSRLWDYANEIKDNGFLTDSAPESIVLAQGVVVLGDALVDQLRELRAYDEKHQFNYHLSGRIAHADLILAKI